MVLEGNYEVLDEWISYSVTFGRDKYMWVDKCSPITNRSCQWTTTESKNKMENFEYFSEKLILPIRKDLVKRSKGPIGSSTEIKQEDGNIFTINIFNEFNISETIATSDSDLRLPEDHATKCQEWTPSLGDLNGLVVRPLAMHMRSHSDGCRTININTVSLKKQSVDSSLPLTPGESSSKASKKVDVYTQTRDKDADTFNKLSINNLDISLTPNTLFEAVKNFKEGMNKYRTDRNRLTSDRLESASDLNILCRKRKESPSESGSICSAGPEAIHRLKGDKLWVVLNVVSLGIAFMILSTAFDGTVDLQSSMNAGQGLGTISLTSMYIISVLSNLCLPMVIIRKVGCKRTVAVCFLAYIPFIIAQMDATYYTLIPGAILIGIALGPIYCAACTYLKVLAQVFSRPDESTSNTLVVRFLAVFYMFINLSQVWGNVVSAFVLSREAPYNSSVEMTISRICGANFCPNDAANEADPNLWRPSKYEVDTIIKIYLSCTVIAFFIVMFGVSSLSKYRTEEDCGISAFDLLTSTVKMVKERNQLLLIPISLWLGTHKAFIEEEFTEAFVACAWGMGGIGNVMITYSVTTVLAAVVAGSTAHWVDRAPVLITATLLHASVVVAMLLWQPETTHKFIFFAMAMLWAVTGSVWLVHLTAMCGNIFPGREEAAFSNLRLWEALGFVIASGYSHQVCMRHKLYFQLGFVLTGTLCYLILEVVLHKQKKKWTLSSSSATLLLRAHPAGSQLTSLSSVPDLVSVGVQPNLHQVTQIPGTPDQDSNHDLSVMGSLVYCESSALDHTATEVGLGTVDDDA
uniref:UNC93-like protein n=1 Tax=Timema cristinae TaxID=61476 RepID=A0A7R9H2U5_TIMCR|nr:unnamed protein product [Timema cristinae]